MRWLAAILTAMLGLGGPAVAQTPSKAVVIDGFPLPLDASPPADTGKPRLYVLPPSPLTADCAAAFDCRVRVIGAIRHDGTVELNATVLKW